MEFQCDATYENDEWVAGIDCENGYRAVEYDEDGFYQKTFTMADCGDTTSISVARRENGEMVEENYFTRMQMTPVHSRMLLVSTKSISAPALGRMNSFGLKVLPSMIPKVGSRSRCRW